MARVTAKNASLYVHDNTGASQSVSGRFNNLTLTFSAEAPEVTSFGEGTRARLPNGLMDFELGGDCFYDAAAGNVDAIFFGLIAGSGTFFQFGPTGSTSASVKYSGCVALTEYAMAFGVADAGTATVTLVARSGSLTRGTWA